MFYYVFFYISFLCTALVGMDRESSMQIDVVKSYLLSNIIVDNIKYNIKVPKRTSLLDMRLSVADNGYVRFVPCIYDDNHQIKPCYWAGKYCEEKLLLVENHALMRLKHATNGQYCITESNKKNESQNKKIVKLWKAECDTKEFTVCRDIQHKDDISDIIFSPNAHYIASVSIGQELILTDLTKEDLPDTALLTIYGPNGVIEFSEDSTVLCSTTYGGVVFWNTKTKQAIKSICINKDYIVRSLKLCMPYNRCILCMQHCGFPDYGFRDFIITTWDISYDEKAKSLYEMHSKKNKTDTVSHIVNTKQYIIVNQFAFLVLDTEIIMMHLLTGEAIKRIPYTILDNRFDHGNVFFNVVTFCFPYIFALTYKTLDGLMFTQFIEGMTGKILKIFEYGVYDMCSAGITKDAMFYFITDREGCSFITQLMTHKQYDMVELLFNKENQSLCTMLLQLYEAKKRGCRKKPELFSTFQKIMQSHECQDLWSLVKKYLL